MNLRDLQTTAHRNAVDKGFWMNYAPDDGYGPEYDAQIAQNLALIHAEVSEALEAYRKNQGQEAWAEELADIVIRVLDLAEGTGVNMELAVYWKMRKNAEREHLHGHRF